MSTKRIALLGYGKMGKMIESLALKKGHEIVLRIDRENADDLNQLHQAKIDVAIDFSLPQTAVKNISKCLEAGIPVISGTTGWLDQLPSIQALCEKQAGAFLYASNFSIGVNLFFALNQYLATLMNDQADYNIELEEIHHTQKLDAPSGTAITLAEDILKKIDRKTSWSKETSSTSETIPILSKRIDAVPGTHSINYHSPIDSIEIKHTAHSRIGFAAGALLASEWIVGKTGCFGMADVFGFNKKDE